MSILQFSNRCVFIPPFYTDYHFSQTQLEEIKQKLEYEFVRLKDLGIKYVLCVGGMGLDYERYDVSHIIPTVMVYHTRFHGEVDAQLYYEVPYSQIEREVKSVDYRVSFLEDLIYQDAYKEVVLDLERTYGYGINIEDFDVEIPTPLIDKYEEKDLLSAWLKRERLLYVWNVDKHDKQFKSVFKGNKLGIKANIRPSKSEYFVCNNLLRESLVFKE